MLRRAKHALVVLDEILEITVVQLFSKNGLRLALYAAAIAAMAMSWFHVPDNLWMDAKAYCAKAEKEVAQKQWTLAARNMYRASKLEPNDLNIHLRYAEVLILAGDTSKALDVLNRTYSLFPTRKALLLMGLANESLKLWDSAIGYFQQAKSPNLKTGPWETTPFEFLEREADTRIGECYVQMGQNERAINHLTYALAVHPRRSASWLREDPAAHFYLGVAYWMTGNHEVALDQFHRALALQPNDPATLYNIACYYSVQNNTQLALTYLERAVAAGFDEPEYFSYDPDLDNIKNNPRFTKMATDVSRVAAKRPAVGTRSPQAISSLIAELQGRRNNPKDVTEKLDGLSDL